ncbi:MAG: methyl-accepting chemotaxis protein [Janthinobacterium lividum]
MPALRSTSIRVRLAACVGVLSAVLGLVSAFAVVGLDRASTSTEGVGRSIVLTHDAMQAKFRTADFAGWQTGYAFDTVRGVPGAAEDGDQRKAFLASTAAFEEDLQRLSTAALERRERDLLADAQTNFDAFMSMDEKIHAGYLQGSPESIAAANDLASGQSLQLFAKIADDISQIADSVTTRSAAARDAALAAEHRTGRLVLLAAAGGLGLALAAAVLIVGSVTRPLQELRTGLAQIADGDGDLTRRVEVTGRDELTDVAAAFNRFTETIAATVREVGRQAASLAGASQALTESSVRIGENAQDTQARAVSAEDTTTQIIGHMTSAAAGAEEMRLSIEEISRSASHAAQVAAEAVGLAGETTSVVTQLGESSAQINDVVKTITAIAEQTNLLALNATIEAARAGEAGKGFAVVAGEVKELSRETARATEEISRRVQGIALDTTAAVVAISRITGVIGRIDEFQTTIAAAVEEQSATTAEMARSVTEAARGSRLVAENITTVTSASASSATGIAQSQEAIAAITKMGDDLQLAITRFRV